MVSNKKWLRFIFIVLMSLMGLWVLASLDGSTVLACCHGGSGGGSGGDGDNPPKILQINAPAIVEANTSADGTFWWEDKDGDADWAEFLICTDPNTCSSIGGEAFNPWGLKSGSSQFKFSCVGVGSRVGVIQLTDEKRHSTQGSFTFNCVEGSAPPTPPPPSSEQGNQVVISSNQGTDKLKPGDQKQVTLAPDESVDVKLQCEELNALIGLAMIKYEEDDDETLGLAIAVFNVIFTGGADALKVMAICGSTFAPLAASLHSPFKIELLQGPIEATISHQEISLDVSTPTTNVSGAGLSRFGVSHDPVTGESAVAAYEGTLNVQPKNSGLQSVTLQSGQQVAITQDSVGSVTPISSGPSPTPPPSSGGSSLQSYDANNNNLLEDDEFFVAIDAWIGGRLDDNTFFQAIDLWISGQPIAAAASSLTTSRLNSITLATSRAGRSLTFAARGQGITSMGVEIFDLNGQRIFTQSVTGTRLTWNLQTSKGQPVANGAYLYRVTLGGAHGERLQSEIRKLLVLR